ncbi:MAG: 5-formyltetrahydrofolate cyclo-ligase [Pyrinomonadaceae bacterium]
MTKSELRKIYLAKRREISTAQRANASREIIRRVFESFDFASVRTVHCFIAIRQLGEIDTTAFLEKLWTEFSNIRISAPRIDERTNEIDAVEFGPESKLVENKWRIPEPIGGNLIDPSVIDLVVVPLLCFDRIGHRVGYGKGFYDRFLDRCRPDCLKIGLSYFDPVDLIDDVHSGDVRLDFCVTPSGVVTSE